MFPRRRVALVACLLTLGSAFGYAWAGDEPDLPTEGIDDPVPGVLDLPFEFQGGYGQAWERHIVPERLSPGATWPDLVIRYGPAKSASPRDPYIWHVEIRTYAQKGAAHHRLHRRLKPTTSMGHPPPWTEQLERVAVSGLVYRVKPALLDDRGAAYLGVVRQCWIELTVGEPRSPPADMATWRPSIERESMDVLARLVRAVCEAKRAELKSATSLTRIVGQRTGEGQGTARPKLAIRMTAKENVDLATNTEAWIVTPAGDVYVRHPDHVSMPLPPEAWTNGWKVRVLLVHKSGRVSLEDAGHVTLSASAQSEWVGVGPKGEAAAAKGPPK